MPQTNRISAGQNDNFKQPIYYAVQFFKSDLFFFELANLTQ